MLRVYCLAIILLVLSACKSHKAAEKTGDVPVVNNSASNSAKPVSNKEIQLVHLPVFIPTSQLQKQLYDNFFAPNYGKYYPCRDKPDCDDSYKDIYVEEPFLKVNGDYMNIKLHVAGQAKVLVFHPDINGDISLIAKPVVRNDTLFFEKVSMEKSSQSFILKIASAFFEKQIIKKIQDNAWYAFRPTLDKYTADYQKQMPLKWQSSVLLISLKKIYLNKVNMQQPPNDGIIAYFSAELQTEDSSYGR